MILPGFAYFNRKRTFVVLDFFSSALLFSNTSRMSLNRYAAAAALPPVNGSTKRQDIRSTENKGKLHACLK